VRLLNVAPAGTCVTNTGEAAAAKPWFVTVWVNENGVLIA